MSLLAYGSLCGAFLSDHWLGQPEPTGAEITNWAKRKYYRFIKTAGDWQALQDTLRALDGVAKKHAVSISNVASRWVLDHRAVTAIIVGTRLGESEHRDDNLAVFDFELDADDRVRIALATGNQTPISGDTGDAYRRAPFLTASGDLSHHPDSLPKVYAVCMSAICVSPPVGGA